MEKGSPLDDLTEESEKRVTEDDIGNADNGKPKFLAVEKQVQEDDTEIQNVQIEVEGKEQDVAKGIPEESRMPSTEEDSIRQKEEDELKGTRSEFKVGKSNGFSVEGSKSEEAYKMRPNKALNRVEALKEEAKSSIRNEQSQINGANDLKEKLLAMENELSVERIQSKTIGIFLPSELKKKSIDGTEMKISELDVTPQKKGISPRMTIIFIIAAATGSAFQYLPFHLKESSWFGVFFVLLLGLNSLYACLCTGWCWSLMEEIWPEYAAWTRVPYQDMAYRAAGPWMKYIVSFLFNLTTLVLCCNYILTLSEDLGAFLYPHFTLCHFIIVASIVLAIPAMLGSYGNMKILSSSCHHPIRNTDGYDAPFIGYTSHNESPRCPCFYISEYSLFSTSANIPRAFAQKAKGFTFEKGTVCEGADFSSRNSYYGKYYSNSSHICFNRGNHLSPS